MVELEINDQPVETLKDSADITYTKQVSDLFDLGAIATSYSNSITIPKTPKNVQILQGLGLVGNYSRVPYGRVQARLRDDGFYVVPNGWLTIKELSKDYKGSINSGVIDFLKAIENKTMGLDVNLSNFSHEKNIETVVASFTNEYYTYIIADYNGRQVIPSEGKYAINIDYLVPSFNMGKLLQAVFESFGFAYDFSNIEYLNELYLTYPKAPNENISESLAAEFYKNPYVTTEKAVWINDKMYSPSKQPWDSQNVILGDMTGDTWIAPSAGVYRISYDIQAYCRYRFINDQFHNRPATFNIYLNGNTLSSFITDPLNPVLGSFNIFLNQGDNIRRVLTAPNKAGEGNLLTLYDFRTNGIEMKIYKTNQGNIDLSDAFRDFTVTDFVKECLWHTGCTIILDQDTQEVSFKSISQRLDTSQSQDWSDKFDRRNKESWTDSGFAQKNAFTHKYNEDGNTYANGYLYVENTNITLSKTLVSSKTYAPESQLFTFYSRDEDVTFQTDKFRMWNTEVKEDENENVIVEYKGLSQRFYVLKKTESPVSQWRLASKVVGSEFVDVETIPIVFTEGTTFNTIIPDIYKDYEYVLKDFKIHNFDLVIGASDFNNADLTRPFYFSQEGAHYLMNKLTYKKDQRATAECIKISREVEVIVPELPTAQVRLRTNVADKLFIYVPKLNGYNTGVPEDSTIQISGIDYEPVDYSNPLFVGFEVDSISDVFGMVVESFEFISTNGTDQLKFQYSGPPIPFTQIDIDNSITKIVNANVIYP